VTNLGYLFAAYSLIFVGILLYVLFIGRRQARLEVECQEMEATFERLRESSRSAAAQSR
jgi:CcmD family protein